MIKCFFFGHISDQSGIAMLSPAYSYVTRRTACSRCQAVFDEKEELSSLLWAGLCKELPKSPEKAAPAAPELPVMPPAPAHQVNLDPVLAALNDVAQALLGQGTSTQQAVANIQQLLLTLAQQRP